MKSIWIWGCITVAVSILIGANPASAQEVVFNGDFETGEYSHGWNLTGGNELTTIAVFEITQGNFSTCLKRCPGTPSGNGGIEQQVHLMEGVTYEFNANIAAEETG